MQSLGTILSLLGQLRALDPDMPMAQAYCLFLISRDEGLSLKELAHRADIGMASASRYVSQFGESVVPGRKGLGLVLAKEDPLERRKKIITLTPKGRQVVGKILAGQQGRGGKHANL
jgi:DNA-binding MarR family transcriptional regulator